MKYIAIDPGKEGAIAVFEDLTLKGVIDIELVEINGQDIFSIDDARRKIIDLLGDDKVDLAFIESVSSRSNQGVKSTFSFGGRFAEAKSLGLTFTQNVIFLNPAVWKRSTGLIGLGKSASAKKCAKIYPKKSELFVNKNSRCKDGFKYFDGRGDAVLIGLTGYKKLSKEIRECLKM